MQDITSGAHALNILGIEVRAAERGRFCLNDLHAACGGAVKHKPGQWMRHDLRDTGVCPQIEETPCIEPANGQTYMECHGVDLVELFGEVAA